MSFPKGTRKKTDPVVSDQGGRLMQVDPHDSPNAARPNAPREEVVRRKAYELYEVRGKTDGHDLEDWLRAEALVS